MSDGEKEKKTSASEFKKYTNRCKYLLSSVNSTTSCIAPQENVVMDGAPSTGVAIYIKFKIEIGLSVLCMFFLITLACSHCPHITSSLLF